MKRPKTGAARVERLIALVKTLGIKAQLQLIDSITQDLVVEGLHGVRYTTRSVVEYKRSTKQKPWDAPLADWIRSFSRGDVFFDIGANTGSFSLIAGALHREDVPVFAFEPGFESFEALVRNVIANRLSGVITPLPVALADRTTIERFNYHNLGAGSAMHALGPPVDYKHNPFEPAATQQVMTFSLDEVVELFRLPRPTRIKLDVDGTESRVIAGATRTLAAGACELWVEMTEGTENDPGPAAVVNALDRLGFTLTHRLNHHETVQQLPRIYDGLFIRH
jgi:FkbM family methyltransferase